LPGKASARGRDVPLRIKWLSRDFGGADGLAFCIYDNSLSLELPPDKLSRLWLKPAHFFSDSLFAWVRIGKSGSASFHIAKKVS
jgi:hypothetical protein